MRVVDEAVEDDDRPQILPIDDIKPLSPWHTAIALRVVRSGIESCSHLVQELLSSASELSLVNHLTWENAMLSSRNVVTGFAALGLAFVTTQAPAQQKSLQETIASARIITSVFDEYQNGEKKDNWGGPVKGQITFGRTGRFTQFPVGPTIASMKGEDPRKPDAMTVAYYGTYSVDEAGKTETQRSRLPLTLRELTRILVGSSRGVVTR